MDVAERAGLEPDPGQQDRRGEGGGPIALSLVIPLYRDEDAIATIFARLEPVLDEFEGVCELVLVDDGSPDRSGPLAEELAESYRHPVTVVRLARNFGQHPAVFAGLAHTRGQTVVTMDSDLQYPPDEIRRLLEHLSDDYPVVSGYREDRKDPWPRKVITRMLTRWLNRQTGSRLRDFGSMFRAYDRRIVDRMLTVTERHRYVPAVVAWLGAPVKEIPVRHEARGEQGSRYRIATLVEMVLDLVTGYAVFPLRLVSFFAVVVSMVGFTASAIFIAYRIFVGDGIDGTISAFALLFFLGGAQTLAAALIGEYVGRIYTEAKARPYYLVGSVTRHDP